MSIVIFGIAFNCYKQRGRVHVNVWNPRLARWQKYGNFASIDDLRAYVDANIATINF